MSGAKNLFAARRGLIALVILGIAGGGRLAAQDPSAQAQSLKLVPADAATYSVLLRNGEQIDAITKSKAWARLNSLPLVKMAWQKLEDEWKTGHLAMLRQWYEQPANTELVRVAKDLIADEVFVYGGRNSADLIMLFQTLASDYQWAPLMAAMRGDFHGANDPVQRGKMVLKLLADNADDIKIPDFVIGFRAKDANAVDKQLKRLDALMQIPELRKLTLKKKIGDSTFRMLQVSGEMIPWNMIPIGQLEDQPGDLDKLVKRLKEMKLTVALGQRDNFLLLGIGEGMAGIEALGQGRALADVTELKPLAKFADRKLCNISYVSKAYQSAISPSRKDLDATGAWILDMAKNAALPAQVLEKLKKDMKEFAKDFQRFVPEPGAYMAFSFLTDRGSEGYAYDWTKNHGLEATKPLTLLEHIGGNPLFFTVARYKYDPKDYEIAVKWIKIGYGYVEEFALPNLPPDARDVYDQFMKKAKPLFERLDKATGKMLLPALADGQMGFVLDGKLKSKQWHALMPPAEKDLAFPELAVVLGVSDVELLKKALGEYRAVANGLLGIAGEFVPVGQFEIPEPESKKIKGGELYFYRLPALLLLDGQIAPSAGLSSKVAAFTLSNEHAMRLLAKTPLRFEGGPLANAQRPLAQATHVNVGGIIDVAGGWIEYGLREAGQGNDLIEQIQAMLEIARVFRSYSSATYAQDGAVVTQSETIIRDLQR